MTIRVHTTQLFRLVTDMARQQVVYVDGLTSIISLGQRVVTGYTGNIKEAIYKEAQDILGESRKKVPYKDGALSSSGRVHDPFVVGKTTSVEITHGGAAGGDEMVNYAIIQHENEDFKHAPGKQAYYLEEPMKNASVGLSGRLARRIQAIIDREAAREVK
jgi:hypothetical protein